MCIFLLGREECQLRRLSPLLAPVVAAATQRARRNQPRRRQQCCTQRQTTGKQSRIPGVLGPANVIHLDGSGCGECQTPAVASACCDEGGGAGISLVGSSWVTVGRIVGDDVRCERAGVFVGGGEGHTHGGGMSGRRTWRWARGSIGGTGPGMGCEGLPRRPARCVVRRLVELALNCGGGGLEDGSTMRR